MTNSSSSPCKPRPAWAKGCNPDQTTLQAAATFARIVQLQDAEERRRQERDALADELGKALDENAALKRALEAGHLDNQAIPTHLHRTGAL